MGGGKGGRKCGCKKYVRVHLVARDRLSKEGQPRRRPRVSVESWARMIVGTKWTPEVVRGVRGAFAISLRPRVGPVSRRRRKQRRRRRQRRREGAYNAASRSGPNRDRVIGCDTRESGAGPRLDAYAWACDTGRYACIHARRVPLFILSSFFFLSIYLLFFNTPTRAGII